MALATVVLESGRDIDLAQLEVFDTYGGLLEGYPCAMLNDRLLARLAKAGDSPVHVVTPTRSYPHPDEKPPPFGPVEVLPRFHCRGMFNSHPVGEEADPILNRSRLDVVWFLDELSVPIPEFVVAAVSRIDWDGLAENVEL